MRKRREIYILFFLLCTIFTPVRSQESLGLSLNNYSGIWGGQINPASLTSNKTYLDINIVGASLLFSNNFAYIPKEDYSLFDLITADTIIPIYGKYLYNGFYVYYKNTDLKWSDINSRINGPSVSFQKGKNAFGLTTSIRAASSGVDIPWEMLVFMYEDLSYPPLQGIRFDDRDFSLSELTWEEISFSYAREVFNKFGHSLSVGVTGKFLVGLNGGYSNFYRSDYIALNSKTVEFYKFQADVTFAMPGSGLKSSFTQPFNAIGYGVAADIGIVYVKRKSYINDKAGVRACESQYADYDYKIGLSLLDLGGITFSKDTEFHTFDIENVTVNTDDLDTLKGMTADVGMRYLSELLTGDPNASLIGNRMRIGLPTAISLQADWHISKPYYLSLFWVHPLHFHLYDTKRAAQLAVVPRYETRMVGVSMPVSLLQYQRYRVGLALRFYTFTIGTECLGTLLNFKDLDSVDIYFSLKFNLLKGRCNPFRKGACYNSRKW